MKRQSKTSGNTIFQNLGVGGGGVLLDKLAHKGGERATLYESDENDRFSTASCDPYMGHTLWLFYTFYHKMDTKDSFEEKSLK